MRSIDGMNKAVTEQGARISVREANPSLDIIDMAFEYAGVMQRCGNSTPNRHFN